MKQKNPNLGIGGFLIHKTVQSSSLRQTYSEQEEELKSSNLPVN